MTPQKRTAAFIRFKEKHTALSDLYWGVHFALDTTAETLSTEKDRTKKIAAIIPPTFEAKRLDVTLAESEVLFPAYLARTRVFLLLKSAAAALKRDVEKRKNTYQTHFHSKKPLVRFPARLTLNVWQNHPWKNENQAPTS